MDFVIKIAETAQEFEQIHQLNYETFIEEIPQHLDLTNQNRLLQDKFHKENVYFIAVIEDKVIGMLAYRSQRPFSLDEKLDHLDHYLPPGCYPAEIRLLSVKKSYRGTKVFFALFEKIIAYCLDQGHDTAVITGVESQLKLYQHIGFQSFGPRLSRGTANFQAMRIDLLNLNYKTNFNANLRQLTDPALLTETTELSKTLYLLPGPVKSYQGVEQAFASDPIPHRSPLFKDLFLKTQRSLAKLANTQYVQIMLGGGTLANDMIALQLMRLEQTGIILANGEFGERLIKHAHRVGLNFHILQKSWGVQFSEQEIIDAIHSSDAQWLWAVHCETSTGMLNDIDLLNEITEKLQLKLVLDCISSLAVVPLDLSKVFLASGSSAKAIGAKTGLAFVFHNQFFAECSKLPVVLDLGYYIAHQGIPFTLSYPLLLALKTALACFDSPGIWNRNKQLSYLVRTALEEAGISLLLNETLSAPTIITVTLPKSMNSKIVGDKFNNKGILLHYNNRYLLERNWIQIVLMGQITYQDIRKLLDNLHFFQDENCVSAIAEKAKRQELHIA